jgi:hypothetical protein
MEPAGVAPISPLSSVADELPPRLPLWLERAEIAEEQRLRTSPPMTSQKTGSLTQKTPPHGGVLTDPTQPKQWQFLPLPKSKPAPLLC